MAKKKEADHNAPKEGRVIGSRITAKGYQNDSMGLLIDPFAFYDFQHYGSRVITIRRTGLPVPSNPRPLIRKQDGSTG